MNRNFKVPSKILKRLETNRENERLYREINSIKPTMSFSLSRECSHLRYNKKREQIREERYTEIERENRILLEKINSIIQNRQMKIQKPVLKNSLNFSIRAKHQREISLQNLGLLKRLNSKKSFYKYLERHRREEMSPFKLVESKKLSPVSKELVKIYENQIELAGRVLSVEVFKGKRVKVVAKTEWGEKFMLELSMSEAKELIGRNGDWKKLVDLLQFDGNELVLYDRRSSEFI